MALCLRSVSSGCGVVGGGRQVFFLNGVDVRVVQKTVDPVMIENVIAV